MPIIKNFLTWLPVVKRQVWKFLASILQTACSNAFSFKKKHLGSNWQLTNTGSDNGLEPNKLLSEPMMTVHCHHIPSLGHSESLIVLAHKKENIKVKMCGKCDMAIIEPPFTTIPIILNVLSYGRCGNDFKCVIYTHILVNDIFIIPSEYCNQVTTTSLNWW